jgi:hypothetical protein
MRTVPVLALLFLGGCYPRLSGEWTDYLEGGDTDTGPQGDVTAAGWLWWYERVGGYWSSGESELGIAGWAPVREEPDFLEAYGGTGGDCVEVEDVERQVWDPVLDLAADGNGDATSRFVGPDGGISLEFDAFSDIPGVYSGYAIDNDIDDDFTGYELDETEFDGQTYAASGILRMPSRLNISPDLDTTNPIVLSESELSFTFSGDTAEVDWMILEVWRATGGDFHEGIACVVHPDEGEIAIPPARWTSSAGDTWYVSVRAVSITDVALDARDGELLRTLAVYEVFGAAEID